MVKRKKLQTDRTEYEVPGYTGLGLRSLAALVRLII